MRVWAEIVSDRVSRVFEADTQPLVGPPCLILDVTEADPCPEMGWVMVDGVLLPEPPPVPPPPIPVLVVARPEVTGPAELLGRGRVDRDATGWDCTVPVGCTVQAAVRVELDGHLLDGQDGRPSFTARFRVPWVPVGTDLLPAGPPVHGDLVFEAGKAVAKFSPPAPMAYLLDQAGVQSRLKPGEALLLPDTVLVVGIQ